MEGSEDRGRRRLPTAEIALLILLVTIVIFGLVIGLEIGRGPAGRLLTITRPVGGTLSAAGIRCGTRGNDCSATRPNGDAIELTPQADAGYTFVGYTGDCAPGGRTIMSSARTCGATFTKDVAPQTAAGATQTLTVTPPTGGTLEGVDILCGTKGSACSANPPDGATVDLHPIADDGFTFMRFTGDCAPLGHTQMTTPRTCSATFSATAELAAAAPPRTPPARGRSGGGAPQPAPSQPPVATVPAPPVPVPPPPGRPAGRGPVVDPSQPGAKPVVAPPTDEDYAKGKIQEMMKDYCDAHEALDPEAVQKIYPRVNMNGLRVQLNKSKYRSVQCKFGEPLVYVSLDAEAGKAVVKVPLKQVYESTILTEKPMVSELITTLTLVRPGARTQWQIEAEHFSPVFEPPATTTAPPAVTTPPPIEEPNKAFNERDLQAARDMIASGNYAAAVRDHLQLVLERDPKNAVALDLKKRAEGAIAAQAAKPMPMPQPGAPPTDEEYAKGKIQRVMKDYCDALETLDPETVQKVYPRVNMNALKVQLNKSKYRSMQCKFGDPLVFASLDAKAGKAAVTAPLKQIYQLTTVAEKPIVTESFATLTLVRLGVRTQWQIELAEFYPFHAGGSGIFDPIAEYIAQMKEANVGFAVEKDMIVGQPYIVRLRLTPNVTSKVLGDQLTDTALADHPPDGLPATAPRIQTQVSTAKYGPHMVGHIVAADCSVVALRPEDQTVDAGGEAEWEWQVTPLKAEKLRIAVRLEAIVEKTASVIRVFEGDVEVHASFRQRAGVFLGTNWQWLWTTVAAPAVGYWYAAVRSKRKKGAKRRRK